MGAIGFRSLPVSLGLWLALIVAGSSAIAAGAPGFASGDNTMDAWREYALSRITPEFSWSRETSAPVHVPSVRDRVDDRGLQLRFEAGAGLALTLDLRPRLLPADALAGQQAASNTPLLGSLATTFADSAASTGLSQRFGVAGQLDMRVVLVQQRFAASFLGGEELSVRGTRAYLAPPPSEASRGMGMEVALQQPLLRDVDWSVAYRSRVNMDAFQNFRGIYGNPGDLDVPARLSTGLAWTVLPKTRLGVAAERIRYSDIEPFVSTALPRRLLAVLGDATSPEFGWRDLDIYSVSLEQGIGSRDRVGLRYSTGQQPRPGSPLLAKILMEDAPEYSIGLSWLHVSPALQWRLMANYAPAEFVLGIPSSARRNRLEHNVRQLEFESLWTWPF